MNLILSTTFQSLPHEKQEQLLNESVAFYYPEWEDVVMNHNGLKKAVEETLQKIK